MKTPSLRRVRDQPLKSLGRRRRVPSTYTPSLLEAIPLGVKRRLAVDHMWVTDHCLRFTSLCPVTGQPDWADIHINYIPALHLVESKSLKEYLHSFRMHGDFHEDVCRTVCDDLVSCIAPRYIEILGHFDSRGSIAIWPYVQYAKPGDEHARRVFDQRLVGYAPGRYAPPLHGRSI